MPEATEPTEAPEAPEATEPTEPTEATEPTGATEAAADGTGVRVLLIEDDADLSGLVARLLTDEGYVVQQAFDGRTGLDLFLTRRFDAVVLDRGLPELEGLEVLSTARAAGVSTPTIVLSARGDATDRVTGLDAGAEDYLTKPFDAGELLARLRALRRRHVPLQPRLQVGGRTLDIASRVALSPRQGVKAVELSQREVELLVVLAGNPDQAFTRAELRRLVFREAESDAVVDTYVHYCRRKLGRDAVRTVRGIGYRIGGQ